MDEMLDSGTGTGKAYDDLEHLGSNKDGNPQGMKGSYQKDPEARLKEFPSASSRVISDSK